MSSIDFSTFPYPMFQLTNQECGELSTIRTLLGDKGIHNVCGFLNKQNTVHNDLRHKISAALGPSLFLTGYLLKNSTTPNTLRFEYFSSSQRVELRTVWINKLLQHNNYA